MDSDEGDCFDGPRPDHEGPETLLATFRLGKPSDPTKNFNRIALRSYRGRGFVDEHHHEDGGHRRLF